MAPTVAPSDWCTVGELEVIRAMAVVQTTRQIGVSLGISTRSAHRLAQTIYTELDATTRVGAMIAASATVSSTPDGPWPRRQPPTVFTRMSPSSGIGVGAG